MSLISVLWRGKEAIQPATACLCIGWPIQLIFRYIMESICTPNDGFSWQTIKQTNMETVWRYAIWFCHFILKSHKSSICGSSSWSYLLFRLSGTLPLLTHTYKHGHTTVATAWAWDLSVSEIADFFPNPLPLLPEYTAKLHFASSLQVRSCVTEF